MAKRSPILGFNHNFRHRGLVFHVQTEDSGVDNPHIFTHLFNGGVILSSRKLTYDASSADEVVKALMQAQHKRMLKDLRKGEFDEKITDYFGDDPNLDGGVTARVEALDSASLSAEIEDRAKTDPELDPDSQTDPSSPYSDLEISTDAIPKRVPADTSGPAVIHARAPDSAPEPPGASPQSPGQYSKKPKTDRLRKPIPSGSLRPPSESRKRPPPIPSTPPIPGPPRIPKRQAGGKAVRRDRVRPATMEMTSAELGRRDSGRAVITNPSVIVGSPSKVVGGKRPTKQTAGGAPPKAPSRTRRTREQGGGSLFGKDLISEKSLDEVILAYLSEDSSEDQS